MAAAEGGLLEVDPPRDGLISCTLFFLDRPGPVGRAEEVFDFGGGRTGEDSLEANGELVADAARVERDFFVVEERDVMESRGLEVMDLASSSEMRRMASVVSDLAAEKMDEEVLSSIATVVVWREMEGEREGKNKLERSG